MSKRKKGKEKRARNNIGIVGIARNWSALSSQNRSVRRIAVRYKKIYVQVGIMYDKRGIIAYISYTLMYDNKSYYKCCIYV